ncbi:hypothetical protein Bbelb_024060 [Branchiostoma belcheri]|nr:hypothetical protein Bbelb_024060 [Branchiostoma belcheri]
MHRGDSPFNIRGLLETEHPCQEDDFVTSPLIGLRAAGEILSKRGSKSAIQAAISGSENTRKAGTKFGLTCGCNVGECGGELTQAVSVNQPRERTALRQNRGFDAFDPEIEQEVRRVRSGNRTGGATRSIQNAFYLREAGFDLTFAPPGG